MLIVESIAKIRRYYFIDGKSLKEISRLLRLSRNTVRKVIRSGATEHRYQRTVQVHPCLGEHRRRVPQQNLWVALGIGRSPSP